jgi:hypothetical protein
MPTALQEANSLITQKASELWICCICGGEYAAGKGHSANFKCGTCLAEIETVKALQKQDAYDRLKQQLLSSIPAAFRTTDRARLPYPAGLDRALRWTFGPTGLLLYGATGCGKSRIVWEVAKREIMNGRKVKAVNSFELLRYPSLFMAEPNAASEFAQSLVTAELLVLDDVFKAKTTERIEELLFAVIDERGMWERPCLITLNDTGETLQSRLTSDRGPALIRRLRDYCTAINIAEVK